ncbi:putative hydrolase/acyltransferase (alpha/beta hydrolase superfamily) [Handroanthus impetiginosus]|uniref:Putative hydrolase/acyltransferase (Alpha/beta hydrolase superfamily) n=1 Tax=Handroanthus impetiginosus TaxID=429701 RepID=A0A2G9I2C9_9LAMI|nr:putative hydrolase/acyltransferase (alpha/beta hydrolase superfamily) [Handroanthus impetiginosus]
MASAAFLHLSSSSFAISFKSSRHFSPQAIFHSRKLSFMVKSSTSVDYSAPSKSPSISKRSPDSWKWKFDGNSVNIHFEKFEKDGPIDQPRKNILMVPTISDVSTVEEWRIVAEEIVGKNVGINWSATIVDWPGLGYSDRPKLDYNADVMEKFLVDFVSSPDSPISSSAADNEYVVFGGGHAATIAVRATKNGFLKPKAIAAVAPTWAGPLPIVFGKDSNMENRYGLLRGTLRAPAVGWMMYNVLVSNEKAIQSQYKSHVYADPENVTPDIIESRYALTKRKGARYVPAAFLTGLLDPVNSREEFVELFAGLEGKLPVLVMSTSSSPKRSKAEMEALRGAKGVSKFVEVPGALLPQEEYPKVVAEELYTFLLENFEPKA